MRPGMGAATSVDWPSPNPRGSTVTVFGGLRCTFEFDDRAVLAVLGLPGGDRTVAAFHTAPACSGKLRFLQADASQRTQVVLRPGSRHIQRGRSSQPRQLFATDGDRAVFTPSLRVGGRDRRR